MLFYLGVYTMAKGVVTYAMSPSWTVIVFAISLVEGFIIGL